jgi:hypothetical protein
MTRYIFILIFILSICNSCRKVYDPKIDIVKDALVVEGLITDEAKPYVIKLSLALPYNNPDSNPVLHFAKVSVSDDRGSTYEFSETGNTYVSDPTIFVGQPGRRYTLHIETPDSNIYESTPQLLLADNSSINVSAVSMEQEMLVEEQSGQFKKTLVDGVNLLTDIKFVSDSLPRYRFLPIITTEYTYVYVGHFDAYSTFRGAGYFCWYESVPDELVNLTDMTHEISSNEIQNHTLCFIRNEYYYYANWTDTMVDYNTFIPALHYINIRDSFFYAPIVNRVITLKQYRINQETYQFYKDLNTILSAQGKIFDPIAFQVKGNISCLNNPQKLSLGFFEASSLKTHYYFIKPGSTTVHPIQSFTPPYPTCCYRWDSIPQQEDIPEEPEPPTFWVN